MSINMTVNAKALIKEAMDDLVKFKDDDISFYCNDAFNIMERTIADEEISSKKELASMIASLDKAFPNISNDIKSKNKQYELRKKGNDERETQYRRNENKIYELEQQLNRINLKIIPSEQPGIWSTFLADRNPGFFKRIFFFFLPRQSILEAQNKYDRYEELKQNLTARLTLENMITLLNEENASFSHEIVLYRQEEKNLKPKKEIEQLMTGKEEFQLIAQKLKEAYQILFDHNLQFPMDNTDNNNDLQFPMDNDDDNDDLQRPAVRFK